LCTGAVALASDAMAALPSAAIEAVTVAPIITIAPMMPINASLSVRMLLLTIGLKIDLLSFLLLFVFN
jgi:hypothetical protein